MHNNNDNDNDDNDVDINKIDNFEENKKIFTENEDNKNNKNIEVLMEMENIPENNSLIINKEKMYRKSEHKAIRLIKLLSTLNSNQQNDKQKIAEYVNVNFNNTYFKDMKKTSLSLSLDLKVKELKLLKKKLKKSLMKTLGLK